MIDLHMHTTYSDGTDSVKELLSKANKINLDVISITDHNVCSAYEEMEMINVSEFYDGNIIVGCEFTTSYKGRLIEVLGYGLDYRKVNVSMNEFYTKEFLNKSNFKIYNRLLKKVFDIGLICDLENMVLDKGFLERSISKELFKHPENREILKEDVWDSFSDFYRKGLTNVNSKLFLNYPEFKPSLDSILNLIHESGGIAFLAHPYQYKFDDTEEFLNDLYDNYDFDGIECFYTTFSKEQSQYLLNFSKERNLLISGGSDYHGTNKKQHELGVGRGNLNIDKNIVSNWNIKYFL